MKLDKRSRVLALTSIFIVAATILLIFLARSIFNATTQGITYYVATTGSDSNVGTIDAPFATVVKARDTIRAAAQTNVTVYIRGGEYDLTTPITFNSTDSGTATAPNVYSNYPGETPIFKGSKAIKTVAGDVGLKTYTLDKITFPNIDATRVPQIFFNGVRQDMARYPNNIQPNFNTTDPYAGYYAKAASTQPLCTDKTVATGSTIYFDPATLDTTGWDLTNYTVQVKIWTASDPAGIYTAIIRPVASIDQSAGKIMMGTIANGVYSPLYANFNICKGNLFYLQGSPNLIDKPGEFAYNNTTRTLSVNLPQTLTSTDKITIPAFYGAAFKIVGASYLELHGLDIGEVNGDGVFISQSKNIVTDGLNVHGVIGNFRGNEQGAPTPSGIEGDAIGSYISDYVTVKNGKYYDAPTNRGISFMSSDARIKALNKSNNQALNNEIYDVSWRGGIWADDYGLTIQHNYIHDLTASAIVGNLTLDDISYNRIENVDSNVCDAGAIYTHGGGSLIQARNNKIHDNFIQSSGGYCYSPTTDVYSSKSNIWSIYLDNTSSYNQIYNNIVVDAVGCGIQNSGWGNSWKNNICITNQGVNANGYTLNGDMSNYYSSAYAIIQNMGTNGYDVTAYQTAFPDLKTMPATWSPSYYQQNLDFENNITAGLLNGGAGWTTGHGAIYFRGINNASNGAIVKNNIYFDPTTAGASFKGGGFYPFSPAGCILPYGTPPTNCQYDYQIWSITGWQSHTFDTNGGKAAVTNPLFTQTSLLTNQSHPFSDNYTLQLTSPALALGFVNIDKSQIGLQPVSTSSAPVVSVTITSPTSGTTVSKNVSVASSASTTTGSITKITLTLDANTIGSSTTSPYTASFDSALYANGGHTLKATATDSNGVSTTTSQALTISNTVIPTSTTVHLDSITGSSKLTSTTWTAKITVTAKDNLGNNIVGAVITGTWSGALTGTASCTISSTTYNCSISAAKIKLGSSATFTVTSIKATGLTYNVTDNTNGSSVTIQSPAPRK